MPKLYNIPDWFTAQYEREMCRLIAEIRRAFSERPPIDRGYMERLSKCHDSEHRAHYRFLASDEEPIFDGPAENVGWNVIKTQNDYVFRRILPGYLRSSIEVLDNGTSEAEIGGMPSMLSERLTLFPAHFAHGESQLLNAIKNLNTRQMSVIRSVLDLIATRQDTVGTAAKVALASYWDMVPPALDEETNK